MQSRRGFDVQDACLWRRVPLCGVDTNDSPGRWLQAGGEVSVWLRSLVCFLPQPVLSRSDTVRSYVNELVMSTLCMTSSLVFQISQRDNIIISKELRLTSRHVFPGRLWAVLHSLKTKRGRLCLVIWRRPWGLTSVSFFICSGRWTPRNRNPLSFKNQTWQFMER